MTISKSMAKSYLRSLVVSIVAATGAYTAAGGNIGFDLKTVLGIGATLILSALPVLQRYMDKTDPAFGAITKAAILEAQKKLDLLANPKAK